MIKAILLGTAAVGIALLAVSSGIAEQVRNGGGLRTLAQAQNGQPDARAARPGEHDDADDDLPSFEDYAQYGGGPRQSDTATPEEGRDRDRRSETRARYVERRSARRFATMCGPEGGRILERMVARMERITKPTDAQRPAFDKLKEAAVKAREAGIAGCPAEPSMTLPGRLADAEKRLAARLEATRILRPAIEAYYALLSDEQKARLYIMSPRPGENYREGRGDRWRGGYRGGRGNDRDEWPRPWRGRS
jgi:hypothetical protein